MRAPLLLVIDVLNEELRKYSGIQFDPAVVEAFARTATARGAWPKEPEPEPTTG